VNLKICGLSGSIFLLENFHITIQRLTMFVSMLSLSSQLCCNGKEKFRAFSNPSTILYARRCNMHISLTPELEAGIKQRVASGYYNNASEVIRDALRFWESNEELVQYMKPEVLKKRLAIGAGQAEQANFVDQSVSDIISEAKNA
jgi:antitoxin ParD1/3/4